VRNRPYKFPLYLSRRTPYVSCKMNDNVTDFDQ
jgi:hypothetical protein